MFTWLGALIDEPETARGLQRRAVAEEAHHAHRAQGVGYPQNVRHAHRAGVEGGCADLLGPKCLH